MISYARSPAMDIRATQLLGSDHLAGRSLHQWRAGEENGALVSDNYRFIRHRWYISATGSAGAHHHRYLRNPLRRHIRLVIEDPAEMVAVWKNLILVWKICSAGVHQVDAGQPILQSDLLRAKML